MRKVGTLIFAAFAALFHTLPAGAQTLEEISKFAADNCENIPKGGITRNELEEKLDGTLIPFLERFGVQGNRQNKSFEEKYSGIPINKLPDSIPTISMCKSELVKLIINSKLATESSSNEISRLTLYLHFRADTSQEIQSVVIDSLSDQGYNISGPTLEPAKYPRRIEYFHKQDQAAAERLADALNALHANTATKGLPRVSARLVNQDYKRGDIGVWL
jgi:hypothetical protein